ncbi:MAG: aldehyde dehydrogenase family protein [Ilumatobacteraceae bacterium]
MRTCADQLAGDAGARWQEPEHRLRRRRPRHCGPGTCNGVFGNQGEVCSAGSRVFVESAIYDDVMQAMVDHSAGIVLGSGLDPATTMGPLVSSEQRERVEGYLTIGEAEGANVAPAGRDRPTRTGRRLLRPLTIFEA